MSNTKLIGVALSGGGPRGIAHIGVLTAFDEAGINVDMLTGTSIGSLVGALYVFGVPPMDIYEYARNMTWWTVTKPKLSRFGLASNEKIREILVDFLGEKKVEDAPIPFAVVATDITTGQKVIIDEGDLAHAVMASSCIPGVFNPVLRADQMLVDGGLSENLPVATLKEFNPDIVIGVDLMTTRTPKKPQGVIDVLMNSFDIALQHTMRPRTDIDVLIKPDMSGFIKVDKEHLKQLFNNGYRAGSEAVETIMKLRS